MKQFFDMTVNFPIEKMEQWLKDQGIEEGEIYDHQDVVISNVVYNKDTGYVEFTGVIEQRLDA